MEYREESQREAHKIVTLDIAGTFFSRSEEVNDLILKTYNRAQNKVIERKNIKLEEKARRNEPIVGLIVVATLTMQAFAFSSSLTFILVGLSPLCLSMILWGIVIALLAALITVVAGLTILALTKQSIKPIKLEFFNSQPDFNDNNTGNTEPNNSQSRLNDSNTGNAEPINESSKLLANKSNQGVKNKNNYGIV